MRDSNQSVVTKLSAFSKLWDIRSIPAFSTTDRIIIFLIELEIATYQRDRWINLYSNIYKCKVSTIFNVMS